MTVGVYFAGASNCFEHDGQVASRPAKSSGNVTGFMHRGQISFNVVSFEWCYQSASCSRNAARPM